jgi:hypothetical protein
MAEFRKATTELKRSINTELALEEIPTPAKLRALAFEEPAEPPAEPEASAQPSGEAPVLAAARSGDAAAPQAVEPR